MTVLQDGRERMLECEACPATTDPFDRDDFEQMIRTARDDGWLIKTDAKGVWTHTCPDCKSGDRLARAQALFSR